MPKLFFPAEIRRDHTFRFRVTDAEKQLIERRARDSGISASDFCRRLALGKRTRSKVSALVLTELIHINAELKNQRESMEGMQEYRAILAGIADVIERIPVKQMEDF